MYNQLNKTTPIPVQSISQNNTQSDYEKELRHTYKINNRLIKAILWSNKLYSNKTKSIYEFYGISNIYQKLSVKQYYYQNNEYHNKILNIPIDTQNHIPN